MDVQEIKFPPVVIFKGDNNAYLKVWTYDERDPMKSRFLQFSGNPCENESKFEVINQPNGYVAIKSLSNGKYWNGNPGAWIRADSASINKFTLFKPVLLSDNKVAFIYVDTGKYCKRFTHYWDNMLNAQIDHIDSLSELSVEEPVIRRTIKNVVYDMENKHITNRKAVVFDEQTIQNKGCNNSDFNVSFNNTYTQTMRFTRSINITAGVSTTIKAGIPAVCEGSISMSLSVSLNLEWSSESSQSTSVTGTVIVKDIAPGKTVKVTTRGEEASISIPFTYEQVDYMPDGTKKHTVLSDGIFHGINQYCTNYEIDEVK
jgi:hypothetical protein